jgi:hypothetical protein
MEPIDIEQELQDLVANEEVLGFFDFTLPPASGAGAVEGLCKVSRPRERRSRSTYVSLFFVVDAPDAETRGRVAGHLGRVDWNACGSAMAGVDCILAIPHRDAGSGAGLFLKEVDVYLDGSRAADAAFLRNVLQPAVAKATGLRTGEITVWEDASAPAATPSGAAATGDTLLVRLRRLAGGA